MCVEKSNVLEISGCLKTLPVTAHSIYEEDFYNFYLGAKRLSGAIDVLSVTLPGRMLVPLAVGDEVIIRGQLRSYNKIVAGASRLDLQIFAREIEVAPGAMELNINSLLLDAHVCKQPTYRLTPFGREIADMLLAVNRAHGKSDYIPAIAWGRNARLASALSVGQRVRLEGRLQSREYEKQLEYGVVKRVAYEVSTSALEVIPI